MSEVGDGIGDGLAVRAAVATGTDTLRVPDVGDSTGEGLAVGVTVGIESDSLETGDGIDEG